MKGLAALVSAIVLIYLALLESAVAQEACEPAVGRIISVQGTVEVRREGTAAWRRAGLEQLLCRGDSIRVGSLSRAAVALANQSVLRIDQNTTLNLISMVPEEEQSLLQLVVGAAQFFSRKPRALTVDTPYVNAAVEGTEFFIRVGPDGTLVAVFEGIVVASNASGSLDLTAGQSAMARPGEAPEPFVMVRPRDAVQWALYYPPILAIQADPSDPARRDLPESIAEAFALASGGDTVGAFDRLQAVPESERGPDFYLYRAALLLNVGRVNEARADIDKALVEAPNSGLAYALRAVIAVAQNDRESALADGRRAVELSPRSAPALIALSYAEQSAFRLEAARDLLLRAVTDQPEDALAWARLAELWLALGYRNRALEAAETAAGLAPELDRTQTVLGFAALTAFKRRPAKEAFERAIALNSADPMPRFGLGLARIRGGDLKKGGADIEAAVGLSPDNALLRAYLGKAYFAEKRAPLDAEQLAIARELDPNDPTAFLYDGIRLQTENQPVAAKENIARSVELNDDRAVYRGRLELDSDRAARQTSLASTFNDLGFTQLGLNESRSSLSLDPSNTSAHRFLSDSYQPVRRREISRVSELLQAQMLQDVNLNPVQPSLSETNLNLITKGGPAEAGFNEFTPVFESNGVQFNTSVFGGNNQTYGGEAVVTGVHDNVSLSAGGFYYNTSGWRNNNDLEQYIVNFFGQAALTPELNVQVELRRRKSDEGDLEFNFDKNDFRRDLTVDRDQDTARLGLRYSPGPASDFLLSYTYSDRDEKQKDKDFVSGPIPVEPFPGLIFIGQLSGPLSTNLKSSDEGHQPEAQYIYRQDQYNVVVGGAYSVVDRNFDTEANIDGTITELPPPFPPAIPSAITTSDSFKSNIKHGRGYVYGNINLPEPVTWTIGASYDRYDEGRFHENSFNPKVGVHWDALDNLLFRAAVFKVMKPSLVNNRTLEPTLVAGFNQFFDDANATKSWRYGAGFDWRPLKDVSLGGEVTWRELDEPFYASLEAKDDILEEKSEQHHRAYAYWTPLQEVALSAEFVYDRFSSENGTSTDAANVPKHVTTYSVPVGARYFHKSGFFAGVTGTWVRQDVRRTAAATQRDGDEEFFVADLALGYRFPKRLGIASFGVNNVFDTSFNYQDDSYREFRNEPATGPYFPERIIFARMTLNF